VERLRQNGGEGGVVALLASGEPPVAIAEAAWWLLFDCRPKLSASRALQLERAVARMDRYANRGGGQPGTGIAWIVDQLQADAEEIAAGELAPIHSLANVVCRARKTASEWRRVALGRPPVRDTGPADRERAREPAERDAERQRAAAYRAGQRRRR
jgi:hypothetical protein